MLHCLTGTPVVSWHGLGPRLAFASSPRTNTPQVHVRSRYHTKRQHRKGWCQLSKPVSGCKVVHCSASTTETDAVTPPKEARAESEPVMMYDEPEAAVLLVACGIGLATGAGVVVFNDLIKVMHEVIWTATLPEASTWDNWARNLPFNARWGPLLLPPAVGGLAVGLLRKATGGFEEQAQNQQQQQQQQSQPNGQEDQRKLKANIATASTAIQQQKGNPLDSEQQQSRSAPDSAQGSIGSASPSDKLSSSSSSSSSSASSSNADRANSGDTASTSGQDSSSVWSLSWLAGNSQECRASAMQLARPFFKATAAVITLGTGNSLGPEGPSVDIGRASARGLGHVLKSKRRRLLALVAAGSGAGVAAGFNAPISGVFFAVETVLQNNSSELKRDDADTTPGLTIAMVLLASVLAAIVSQAGLGQAPAVRVPDYQLQSLYELPLILGFGACCGAVSASYAYSNQVAAGVFKKAGQQGLDPALMPALGGLFTGFAALQYPEVLYQGFGNVNAILQNRGHFPPLLLFQILAMKILCTSVSKGSGLVGGAYAPSIFMGATLGSAFGGTAAFALKPLGLAVAAPQAYALVGVAAMLAANCQVPLTSVLLLFELTRDYFIILPTLAAVGISYWVASLPAASSAFTPSQFKSADQSQDDGMEDSGYMDASTLTSQLGLDVAGEVNVDDANDTQAGQVLSTSKQMTSVGTNGSQNGGAKERAYKAAGNAGQPDLVLSSMDSSSEVVDSASVACALEEACVLLTVDTSMTEALQVMDEVEQKVALVTNAEGAVVGVLTRESIVRQLAKAPNATLKTMQN